MNVRFICSSFTLQPTDENSVVTLVSGIFQEDDKNKDGLLSYEEYSHSAAAFVKETNKKKIKEMKISKKNYKVLKVLFCCF